MSHLTNLALRRRVVSGDLTRDGLDDLVIVITLLIEQARTRAPLVFMEEERSRGVIRLKTPTALSAYDEWTIEGTHGTI